MTLAWGDVWSAKFVRKNASFGDGLVIPDLAAYRLTNSLTLEVWAYIPSVALEAFPLVFSKGNVNSAYQLQYLSGSTAMLARIMISGGFNDISAPIIVDAWNHLAMTYDGSTLRLIINGVDAADLPTSGNIDTNSNPLYVGDGQVVGFNTHGGLLSDLRLWNIVRSPSTINAEKDQRLVGNESGLVGYWPLNDAPGRTAHDLTAAANHGTMTNGDQWSPRKPI